MRIDPYDPSRTIPDCGYGYRLRENHSGQRWSCDWLGYGEPPTGPAANPEWLGHFSSKCAPGYYRHDRVGDFECLPYPPTTYTSKEWRDRKKAWGPSSCPGMIPPGQFGGIETESPMRTLSKVALAGAALCAIVGLGLWATED